MKELLTYVAQHLVEHPEQAGAVFLESHQGIWRFQTLTHLRLMQRHSGLKMRLDGSESF